MIPCLLRPLWVLGETMGRCRPSSPHLSQLYFSLAPCLSSHIYIFGWKCPPTPPLLSDGWRGTGINLGFMGTPLPLSTAVWDPCLPLWLFSLDCSLCICVNGSPQRMPHEQGKWCILRIASKWGAICLSSTGGSESNTEGGSDGDKSQIYVWHEMTANKCDRYYEHTALMFFFNHHLSQMPYGCDQNHSFSILHKQVTCW